ncbi:LOW QUALITY PROTEIN: Set domain containing hypothetical protein [Phytophthora palmivora]|uniref:SET domain-containing protein n=1 Tax=Phytophthora palmivora TaxID=4796 RepID=A0A2P4Y0R0_9STRA|nr:LOW QUALITY PROTEIN: Set domain containing hypothetical protein [Phytophthora palmivora]
MAEVKWPTTVKFMEESEVAEGIKFANIGDGETCQCSDDGFIDSCSYAQLAIFCTSDCCGLGAACSNAPRTLYSLRTPSALRLYDTGRVGLGAFTTAYLEVGGVHRLSEYDAIVEGQPARALKDNSVRCKYVYVEVLECGSITRFMSHACDPNVEFVEMQNRTTVKVMARMLKTAKPEAELTVNYGDQTWFTCARDECWVEPE